MSIWYPEADLVIKHPKIYTVAITCDEVKEGKTDFPIIEDGGVAAKDGKVIAVGTAADMDQYVGEHTEVIDASGKILTPGFVECHLHCKWTGEQMLNLDFNGVTSRQAILDAVAEKAASTPDGEWIEGDGWNELIWEDSQEVITRRELDEIAPNNPVFLLHMTVHTITANSLALEACGYTLDTPQPEGAEIGHYDDGELDGLLYENGALQPMLKAKPALTDEQHLESLVLIGQRLNSYGITSAIDANLNYKQMHIYNEAKKQDKLSYRANLMFYLDPQFGSFEDNLRRLEEMDCVTGFGDDMLKLNGCKVTLDGITAAFTAAMSRREYRQRPGFYGDTIYTQEEIDALVCKATELGWQFGIHTIGDASEDRALHAFQEANKIRPVKELRHYLIHYQLPYEDQWPIMKELGVGVCLQPTLVSQMGEEPLFWPEQVERFQSPGLMFKNGIIAGGSSDSPVVSPDPLLGMYYAISRIDDTTGKILSKGDESKVTPIQALIMWTKNSAFFSHDDDKMGSVEVGNCADFAILDRDCFASDDPTDVRDAKVTKTILGGKVVYEA
ncbi:MAG: amidohydrolase [Gordonibacter sp.]